MTTGRSAPHEVWPTAVAIEVLPRGVTGPVAAADGPVARVRHGRDGTNRRVAGTGAGLAPGSLRPPESSVTGSTDRTGGETAPVDRSYGHP